MPPQRTPAFMLDEDGAGGQEAEEYLREWALESDEKAARTAAFISDPSSRLRVGLRRRSATLL
jgi:hypothetical protein